MLSEKAVSELKKLFEESGEEVPDEEIVNLGTNILTLFNHIYRPIKKEWLAVLDNKKLPNSSNTDDKEHRKTV